MDLTFQVPIALYSIRPCLYHQSHPQLGIVFALAPSLYSFWSYFSTDLQWHIGHLPTWGAPLSVYYHFSFSYCSWGSQGKNTKVVCNFLLQWTTFCQTSPPWPIHLGPTWGQGWWPKGATPRPRSGSCTGAGGLRGTTSHSRSGGVAVRRYPSSKVRSSGCVLLEQQWRNTPCPR